MTVTLLKGLRTGAIAAVVLGANSAAQADVRVLFREGAPTDRFDRDAVALLPVSNCVS